MGGRQHMMALPIDKTPLLLGMGAPQQEHHPVAAGIDLLDDPVGKGLPPKMSMRVSLTGLHRQHGIEQQYPLLGPGFEETVIRCDETWQVSLHLFIDVDQRGGVRTPGRTEKQRPCAWLGPW